MPVEYLAVCDEKEKLKSAFGLRKLLQSRFIRLVPDGLFVWNRVIWKRSLYGVV